MLPFTYTIQNCMDTQKNTQAYIEDNNLERLISDYAWAYQNVGDLVPQSDEQFWSGHFFPWVESWEELQISWNMCQCGMYKQAMASLRSVAEMGLLSVYWNLNDDGHIVIQKWLNSSDRTPFTSEILKTLKKHENFKEIGKHIDLKHYLDELYELSQYVHTKGYKYSNRFGQRFIANTFVFYEPAFLEWLKYYQKVITCLSLFHLVKYPLGSVIFDYSKKFGIGLPSFGGLPEGKVKQLENILGGDIFAEIKRLALQDQHTQTILNWLHTLPDMSRQDIDDQIEQMDKQMIEMNGLEEWLKHQNKHMQLYSGDEKIKLQERIERLSQWAIENNFIDSAYERAKSLKDMDENDQ